MRTVTTGKAIVGVLALSGFTPGCGADPASGGPGDEPGPGSTGGPGGGDTGGTGPGDPAPTEVTWSSRIADIVQRNCVRCHASGRFSTYSPLQTYDQVLDQLAFLPAKLSFPPLIATQMPPYPGGAIPGRCEPRHAYSNDLRLGSADLEAFFQWIENDGPRGDAPYPAEPLQPAPPSLLADTTEYPFAEGYVMTIDETHPTGHKDDWVCVVIDPGEIAGSRWFSGIQINPDARQVFRGAVVWLDRARASLAYLQPDSPRTHGSSWYDCDDGFGFDGEILTGFLPEGEPFTTPPGTAVELPGDALLVVKLHYHAHYDHVNPTDTEPLPPVLTWPDHTSLSVQWRDPGEATRALALTIGDYAGPVADGTGNLTHPFEIPTGKPQSEMSGETMVALVPGSAGDRYAVWAIHPEMQDAGRIVTVSVEDASSSECLAAVPRWDPTWQLPLMFDTTAGDAPLVSGGQRLRIDCAYTNRTNSPLTLADESCRAMIGLVPAP